MKDETVKAQSPFPQVQMANPRDQYFFALGRLTDQPLTDQMASYVEAADALIEQLNRDLDDMGKAMFGDVPQLMPPSAEELKAKPKPGTKRGKYKKRTKPRAAPMSVEDRFKQITDAYETLQAQGKTKVTHKMVADHIGVSGATVQNTLDKARQAGLVGSKTTPTD